MNQTQSSPQLIFTSHAYTRMAERGISREDVVRAVQYGARMRSSVDGSKAVCLSEEFDENVYRLFALTVVVTRIGVVKTVYWFGEQSR